MEWFSIFKGLGAMLSAVIPWAKQRFAERKAGAAPESVPISVDEELMDNALRRLGSIQLNDPWWKATIAGIESVVLRPETFCKPAVRDWLSLVSVKADLKAVARAKLSRDEIPKVIFERLVDSYSSIETTGEHRRYAESAIYTAVAYLQNSVHGSVRDPGGAAITQATALHTVEIVQEGFANLTQAAGLAKNPHIAPLFTEEARHDLDKILRRRATPGQDTAGDLKKLVIDFEDGHRLAAADRAVKQEA